jgi:hypothetical protein
MTSTMTHLLAQAHTDDRLRQAQRYRQAASLRRRRRPAFAVPRLQLHLPRRGTTAA